MAQKFEIEIPPALLAAQEHTRTYVNEARASWVDDKLIQLAYLIYAVADAATGVHLNLERCVRPPRDGRAALVAVHSGPRELWRGEPGETLIPPSVLRLVEECATDMCGFGLDVAALDVLRWTQVGISPYLRAIRLPHPNDVNRVVYECTRAYG